MLERNKLKSITQKCILIAIIIFFTGLIYLTGCTQMTRTEKNLCLSLTSQSYSYVPFCENESECFRKTDALFKSNLSYYQESQLYSFKNSLARSWFFYNKALKQMKKINSLCESGNPKIISNEIHQLKFFLDLAFEESDKAMKKSFEIISYEEKYLTSQKIDLLKEEKIFDSLLAFRQILSELKNGATNSETYVSFYTIKIKEFNELIKANGTNISIEENQFWLKEATQLQENAKEFSDTKSLFPFISPWIRKAFDYFEFSFYLRQNNTILQKIPSSHTIKLYSDLFGEKNSSLKRFVDLINNFGQEYNNLQGEINSLRFEIQKQLSSTENLFEKMKDKAEFNNLFQKITKTKIVAQEEIKLRYETTKAEYFELKEKNIKNEVSLGEEIFALKKITKELNNIISELEYYDVSHFENLQQSCDYYAKDALAIESPARQELAKLFEEIIFFSKKTTSSKEKDKLHYCQLLYEKVEEYKEGKNNFEEINSKVKSSTKNCIETTQLLLKYHSSPEIELLFKKLLDSDVKKETLNEFNESCDKIKNMLENEIMLDFEIVEIRQWFRTALMLEEKYNKAALYLKNEFAQTKEEFNLRMAYFKSFLSPNNALNLEKILPQKNQLLNSIKKFGFDFEKKLLNAITKNIKDTVRISVNSANTIQTNLDFNVEYTVVFYNPFWEITTPFQIELEEQFDFIQYPDPNIANIILGKGVILVFDRLPKGYCQVIFGKKEQLQTTEKDTIIKASNKEGLIKKEINLMKNKTLIDFIIIKTKKPLFYLSSTAIVASKEFFVQDDETDLSVKINNFFSDEKIIFFINVSKIINLKSTFLKNEIDDFGEEALFKIQAQNTLTQGVTANLIIESLQNAIQPSEISLYDSLKNKVPFLIEDNTIIIKNQKFEALESKDFFLKISSTSTTTNLINILLEQKRILNNKQAFKQVEKISDFLDKPVLPLVDGFRLVEENKKIIEEINNNELINQKNELLKSEYRLTIKVANEVCTKYGDYLNKELSLKCESIEKYLEEEMEKNKLNKTQNFLENFLFEVKFHFLEKANSLWKKMDAGTIDFNSPTLNQIKENFFEEKAKLSKEFSTKNSLWAEAYKRLYELYESFVQEKNTLEKKNNASDANFKKSSQQLFLSIVEIISWLEEELMAVDYENNPANYLMPISLSRIEYVKKNLFDFNESFFSEEEKTFVLKPIYDELYSLRESSKNQAIKEFNLGIDKKYDKSTLSLAKSLIDENKYIRAFFSLNKRKEGAAFDPTWLTFFPFLVILVLAFILKHSSRKREAVVEIQKKAVLDAWDE